GGGRENHVDLSLLGTVHADDGLTGSAVASHAVTICADFADGVGHRLRPSGARCAVAIPVWSDDEPVAVVEWYDPQVSPAHEDVQRLLAVAMAQLSLLARREVARSGMELSQERLRRLAMVASRVSSGVIIADRSG